MRLCMRIRRTGNGLLYGVRSKFTLGSAASWVDASFRYKEGIKRIIMARSTNRKCLNTILWPSTMKTTTKTVTTLLMKTILKLPPGPVAILADCCANLQLVYARVFLAV
jgi:hypothetical protein